MNEEMTPYNPPELIEYIREGARKNKAWLQKRGYLPASEAKDAKHVVSSAGLDDALGILINISKEYQRLCDVMLTMEERPSELKAGSRFMDALENLRDELLKRKSSNAKLCEEGGK